MIYCVALLCAVGLARPDCQKETAEIFYSFVTSSVQTCYWQASNYTSEFIYRMPKADRPKVLATTYMKIRYRHIKRGN